MTRYDAVTEAKIEFDRVIRRKTVEAIEGTLRKSLSKFFEAQGIAMERAFRPYRRVIEEALTGDEADDIIDDVIAAQAPALQRAIVPAVREAALAGARGIARDVATSVISFEIESPRVRDYIDRVAAARVTAINDTTRQRMRELIARSQADRESYSTLAKRIRDQFDGFAGIKPQRHIRDRAELVAVTEIGDAYEEGSAAGVQQVAQQGYPMEKRWITVADDRVSEGCAANEDAGWIGLSDPFPSGHDRPLRFPGCRCTAAYRLNTSSVR